MKKYSTGAKIRQALIVVLVIVNAVLWGMGIWNRSRQEPDYIDSWEITENRHIEWTWAGKGTGK